MNDNPTLKLLADQCVKCGLCLPACPTYNLDQRELESPRGRIALVSAYARGAVALEDLTTLDRCLGCMNCQSACPAGVDYAQMHSSVQAARTRDVVAMRWRALAWLLVRLGGQRWLWSLARYSGWLTSLLGRAVQGPRALLAAFERLPDPGHRAQVPRHAPSDAPEVMVLAGCLGGGPDAPVLDALERVLARADLRVRRLQGCCGGIAAQTGLAPTAAIVASSVPLLVLSSGCLLHLQATHPNAVDATDYVLARLTERGLRIAADPEPRLHRPCSARTLKVQGTALSAAIGGSAHGEGMGCCGGAGLYPLTQPERAARLLEACAVADDPRPIISGNAGCRLQLASATTAPVYHPVQWLDLKLGAQHA